MTNLYTLLTLTLAAMVAASPAANSDNTNVVRGTSPQYIPTGRTIIRLKRNASQRSFDVQLKAMIHQDVSASQGKNAIIHQYTHRAVKGYAITATDHIKAILKAHPMVDSVEEDTYGWIEATQDNPPSWGLSRISSRTFTMEGPYTYNDKAGAGVTAYIMDTGIDTKHPDFENRATFGLNLITNEPDDDGEGHGSHVAGIVASKSFGIAKQAKLVAVKVCTSYGRCTLSDAIAGLEWIIKDAKDKQNKAVVNISLGLAPSQAMDDLVQAAVDAGVAIICSGGNANVDSCLNSPRRAPAAFAVGATDKVDRHSSFSNFGKCIDAFAPGVGIISVQPGGKNVSMTGTSMASPHVAGIAALYLAEKEYASILDLHTDLRNRATPNAIKNMRNANTTVNLFAYSRLTDDTVPATESG